MLIGAAPANTPFLVNGRITEPWRAWLNTVTSTGAVVEALDTDTLRASLNLSDLASASAARTNLGLGSASTHDVSDFDAAGSAASVQAASLQKSSNLSDVANAATARTNLGLGTAATQASTAFDAAGAASAAQAASLPASTVLAATKTAVSHQFLTAYNAASGAFTQAQPSFADISGSIATGQVPTLNQNTSGTAANVTGVVALANGGTGQTTAAAALAALGGASLTASSNTFTGGATFGGSLAVQALSGSASSHGRVAIGRTAIEFDLGVAGTAGAFFPASVAGDCILKGVAGCNMLLGINSGTPAMMITFSNRVLTGTTTDNGVDQLQVAGSASFSNAAATRTNLGLGTAATQASTAFDAAGAASAAQAASLQKSSNLSDVANAATARTNLGLGTAATQASTAFDAAGAASAAQAASLQKASNLSDVANAATARTNLAVPGLATINTFPLAQTFTGGATFGGSLAVQALSGSASSHGRVAIGRTAIEFDLGVAGTAGAFFPASVAGDCILKGVAGCNMLLGINSGTPAMMITFSNRVLTGTTTDNGVDQLQVAGSASFSNAAATRTNLGLGTAATQASTAFDAAGAASAAQAASLQKSSNLSDVANRATALANLVGAWQSWTPTVTGGGSMTIGSVSVSFAQYLQLGSLCFVQFQVQFTPGGTPSSLVTVSLPVGPQLASNASCQGAGTSAATASLGWIPLTCFLTGGGVQVYAGGSTSANYQTGVAITVQGNFSYRCV